MKINVKTMLILIAIPLVVGGALFLFFQREVLFEIPFVVFGLLLFAFYFGKISSYDRENFKEKGTIKKDKTSENYFTYRKTQNTLIVSGLINIIISYIIFLLLG